MRRIIRNFAAAEDGATTVDWVMITALAMSLGLAAFGTVKSGTKDLSNDISSTVGSRTVTTTFQ